MGELISMFLYQPPDPPTPLHPSRFFWLPSHHGNSRIPVTYIKYSSTALTLLYSHGNAEDLGLVYEYLANLSRGLKVNICAYDYSGYGYSVSSEPASERGCYGDIEAVYEFLLREHRLRPRDIVLYGRSIGGGPSCYLANKTWKDNNNSSVGGVGGLILHSAFTSVFRVALNIPGGFTMSGDMFPNIDRLRNLGCPVYIMHGSKDEIVPFSHGKALYNALPEQCKINPFWAQGMGHNNIDAEMPIEFYRNLKNYFRLIDSNNHRHHHRGSNARPLPTTIPTTATMPQPEPHCSPLQHCDAAAFAIPKLKNCMDFSSLCIGSTTCHADRFVKSRIKIPFMSGRKSSRNDYTPEERSDASTTERMISYGCT